MPKKIAVGFNPDHKPFLTQVASGVLAYGRANPEYRYQIMKPELAHMPIHDHHSAYRDMDGVITGLNEGSVHQLDAYSFPKVHVGPTAMNYPVHWVGPDFNNIALEAMQFFQTKGCPALAYIHCGDSRAHWSGILQECCTTFAQEHDLTLHTFHEGPRQRRRKTWDLHTQLLDLRDFLKELPLCTGVFTPDDEHAWRVIRAAEMGGIHVPDELNVLGVLSDPFISEFTHPPISHVFIDYQKIGYLAAETVHRLLTEGEPPTPHRITVPSSGVTERGSTSFAATQDPVVLRAVEYMKSRLAENPSIDDMAHAAHVSRSTLFRRFEKAMGKKPGEVYRAYRLEEARKQLLSTNKTPVEIAMALGFSDQSHFTNAIKLSTGRTPGELRADMRVH